jgi:signal transduction histidine kinase
VLYNLISNAVKHHDRHHGRGVVVTRVENGEDGKLTIVVADDGPGIATEFRDRIFEPHVRGATTKDGVGLGLAIAREAVEQMGGSIELLPHDGRGATFRVTIRTPRPHEDGKPAS